MIRIVFVLVIVFLLIVLVRKLVAPAGKTKVIEGEKLVQCRYCGVYIAEASAITGGDYYFCSVDHKDRLKG